MKAMILVAGALALSAVTLKAGLLPVGSASATSTAAAPEAPKACAPLLDYTFPGLQDEKPRSMCEYAGKVVLVVNTASFCGYTGQYEGLERLYDKYKARGLVVVGFPSNDFGNQEPGTNKEIADFCRLTYGVRFPMFARSNVSGRSANPLYRQLGDMTGERPRWNFHKYLIDRSGTTVKSFPSEVSPDNALLVATIERLLAAKP